MSTEMVNAEQLFRSKYEEEQYALVHYIQHGNPGPVLRQIAENRIKDLEAKKCKSEREKYQHAFSPMPRLAYEECETVGTHKKELI